MTMQSVLKSLVCGAVAIFSILIHAPGASANGCDIELGRNAAAKCVACHALDDSGNKVGPTLKGVVGRPAASYPGFSYSRALRKLEVIWTSQALDAFLQSPQKYARGTSMAFAGLKNDQERRALICFLKTLEGAHP